MSLAILIGRLATRAIKIYEVRLTRIIGCESTMYTLARLAWLGAEKRTGVASMPIKKEPLHEANDVQSLDLLGP